MQVTVANSDHGQLLENGQLAKGKGQGNGQGARGKGAREWARGERQGAKGKGQRAREWASQSKQSKRSLLSFWLDKKTKLDGCECK